MTKKIISAVAAFLIVASAGTFITGVQYSSANLTASAETDKDGKEYTVGTYGSLTYHKYDNRVIIAGCDDSAETVKIPAVIENRVVAEIGEGAFANCENLKEVTIPVNIVIIQPNAFYGCTNLETINLGSDVGIIDTYAFYGCTSLTSIILPKSVAYVEDHAFSGCESLTEITVLNPDCKIADSPATISTSNEGDNGIINYSGVICGYDGSTAQAYAEKYGYTFESLGKAPERPGESYTMGTYQSLIYFKYADYVVIKECDDSVEVVEIPAEIEGLPVIKIVGDGFYGCKNVKQVTIPNTVREISACAFMHCGITSVTLPESVVKLGNCAFSNCEDLTEITILNPVCIFYGFNDLISNGRDENNDNKTYYGGVIRGYENSSAKAYAEEYGYKFESIGEVPYILGDVNEDIMINSTDASLVLTEFSLLLTGQESSLTPDQFKAADVNRDGTIDATDASMILAYYAAVSTGTTPSWDQQ